MQVSLESTSGLERRLTVVIPAEVVDSEINRRLQDAAKNVRINGFRKGKVPLNVVKQRFGLGIHQDVLGETINRSLGGALAQVELRPAGTPQVEPKVFGEGKGLEYTATFEVYPAITLNPLDGMEVTQLCASVEESDIDDMIQTLRKSQASWQEVTRPAAKGDRVVIDFVGTQNGVAFEGGSAQGRALVLGSNSMIPGFEEGIEGMAIGETRNVPLVFPADYHNEALKGAEVNFAITLQSVSEEKIPEIDDAFFTVFGITEGGLEKFRQEVKDNMENEKTKAAKNTLKTAVFNALLQQNPIEVPKALVQDEIEALRKQTLQQYGQLNTKLDVKALLPDDMFREKALRRTTLGLLISEVMVKNQLKPEESRVRALIETAAATYEQPQSVIDYYYGNEELLAGVQAAALEEQVVDILLASMTVIEKNVPYQEIIRPATAENV